MQIPLDQFEQIIDAKILKRGYTYFKNGYVGELDEVSPNTYETIVEGSEIYTVCLTIENDVIIDHSCDCPYNMGPVCKHVVAAIFALQKEMLQLDNVSMEKKGKSITGEKKTKNIPAQVAELLEKATIEELKALINDEAQKNTLFANRILATFEHYNNNASKELYQKRVTSLAKAATDRYGFVDYTAARTLGKAVGEVLASADTQIERGNYQNAFFICSAVIEKMGEVLEYADDSSGNIGGCISRALRIIKEIADSCETESICRQIFCFYIEMCEKNIFNGMDWYYDMLNMAVELIDTDSDYNQVMNIIDTKQHSTYSREIMQKIKYDLLFKRNGEKVATRFLMQNLTNSKFRKIAIERALVRKDYEQAKIFAHDGIKADEKRAPGLVDHWHDYLLKIAIIQDDKPKIIKHACRLYQSNIRDHKAYFSIIKANVLTEEWDAFVDRFVAEINPDRYHSLARIAYIYIECKKWDKLWELVKYSENLSVVAQYEHYLAADYSVEIADLYAKQILSHLEHNLGREHYQDACSYIRRMIKLGQSPKANKLIAQLRTLYPRRAALMQELDRV